jgi:hypothetical protein
MFRDQTPNPGEHAQEVEEVEPPERLPPGGGELQDHQPPAGFEDPREFAEALVEAGQVPDTETHGRAIEARIREREPERIRAGRDDRAPSRLGLAVLQHREGEVAGEDLPPEPGPLRQFQREVQRPRAGVQETALGRPAIQEQIDGTASPAFVYVQAEEVVEQVVARRDRAEHAAHRRGFLLRGRQYSPLNGPDRHRASDSSVIVYIDSTPGRANVAGQVRGS